MFRFFFSLFSIASSFHSFATLTSTPAYLKPPSPPEGFSSGLQLSFSHAYKLQYLVFMIFKLLLARHKEAKARFRSRIFSNKRTPFAVAQ